MKFLKQSTAAVIPFGPALLPADGVTLVTTLVSALDHASTGIFLCKNGGAAAVRHATVTATTYDAYGSYLVTLDTTDTGTLGRLRVMFAAAASCLPIWEDFTVLSANVYDSLVAASSTLLVDTTATANVDALLDRANGVEASWTLRQALRIILAVVAGKLNGGGTTTVNIRDMADSKNRIVSTVDGSGNRSAVTRDAS